MHAVQFLQSLGNAFVRNLSEKREGNVYVMKIWP